jgi:DNA polymerase
MTAILSPAGRVIEDLRNEAAGCRRCPLWERATQTVFGEGPARAAVLFVGEQPGDTEDREGRPFVGPAGRVLDEALEAAGVDRGRAYVTNAVKHFKWKAAGRRRIHDKPNERELAACRPWLEAEIAALKPRVVVCLGATAAQSLLGSEFRVTRRHGEIIPGHRFAPWLMATFHPSSVLRQRDSQSRAEAKETLVADLRRLVPLLEDGPTSG